MIRNFPHQINSIQKLHGALECASELLSLGQDISDDAVFGYALARKGVYAFQMNEGQDLEARIKVEQQKPESSQGARTSARDLRRTLKIFGLIEQAEGTWYLAARGTRIIDLGFNLENPEYRALWQDAILQVGLDDGSGAVLSPAKMMLDVISKAPGVEKKWLALVLAAEQDSEAEVGSIVASIRSNDFRVAVEATGSTEFQAANAVKILPSLLQQVSLIEIKDGRCYLQRVGEEINRGDREVVASSRTPTTRARRGRTLRAALLSDIREAINRQNSTGQETVVSVERQLLTIERRERRYKAHQQALAIAAEALDSDNLDEIKFTEDSFDLLAKKARQILLIEVKTIGKRDELHQARLALGQLLFYDYFDVRPLYGEDTTTIHAVVFDNEPGEEIREFLLHNNVFTIVILKGSIVVPEELRAFFGTTVVAEDLAV